MVIIAEADKYFSQLEDDPVKSIGLDQLKFFDRRLRSQLNVWMHAEDLYLMYENDYHGKYSWRINGRDSFGKTLWR